MLLVYGDSNESECIEVNISSKIFFKVLEYLKWHRDNPPPPADTQEEDKDEFLVKEAEILDNGARKCRVTDDIIAWDREYINISKSVLFELLLV